MQSARTVEAAKGMSPGKSSVPCVVANQPGFSDRFLPAVAFHRTRFSQENNCHLHRVGLAAAGCPIGEDRRIDPLEDSWDHCPDLLIEYLVDVILLTEEGIQPVVLAPTA